MQVKVYYTKHGRTADAPNFYSGRNLMMGWDFVQKNCSLMAEDIMNGNIASTHQLIAVIPMEIVNNSMVDSLEKVYNYMQGHNWSPNGEARELVRALGLSHTSMSMGDIIQVGEMYWIVDTFGFVQVTDSETVNA